MHKALSASSKPNKDQRYEQSEPLPYNERKKGYPPTQSLMDTSLLYE